MKQMILTGLAEEMSFNNGGGAHFYLVFNNGEFRVPISQESAEAVVQEMVKEAEDQQLPQPEYEEESSMEEESDDVTDEAGISQI